MTINYDRIWKKSNQMKKYNINTTSAQTLNKEIKWYEVDKATENIISINYAKEENEEVLLVEYDSDSLNAEESMRNKIINS